ncbi:hypothetical protein ACFVU2_06235 [Leifsonia sp. NPDC058194]|uniref:hypothetical protein n=1 Tax=Leifsonia sp. NPDC058194 TaxID=3346374 RepID=UPI0036D8C5AD
MAHDATVPLGVVVLVGVVALAIGMVVGASVLRGSARTDPVIAARRAWARAKLASVFGLRSDGDGDDEDGRVTGPLVPPDGLTPRTRGPRPVDSAADESADLMLLQPRRGTWARDWLFNSQIFLEEQADTLHGWMHAIGRDAAPADRAWREANAHYVRRVHRVESTLALWADGHWITHSSLRLRITSRRPFWGRRLRRSLLVGGAPADVLRGEYPPCDCLSQPSGPRTD